jgi:hypothetical protein
MLFVCFFFQIVFSSLPPLRNFSVPPQNQQNFIQAMYHSCRKLPLLTNETSQIKSCNDLREKERFVVFHGELSNSWCTLPYDQIRENHGHNIGESFGFLSWIVKHYYCLPSYVVFLHSGMKHWHRSYNWKQKMDFGKPDIILPIAELPTEAYATQFLQNVLYQSQKKLHFSKPFLLSFSNQTYKNYTHTKSSTHFIVVLNLFCHVKRFFVIVVVYTSNYYASLHEIRIYHGVMQWNIFGQCYLIELVLFPKINQTMTMMIKCENYATKEF